MKIYVCIFIPIYMHACIKWSLWQKSEIATGRQWHNEGYGLRKNFRNVEKNVIWYHSQTITIRNKCVFTYFGNACDKATAGAINLYKVSNNQLQVNWAAMTFIRYHFNSNNDIMLIEKSSSHFNFIDILNKKMINQAINYTPNSILLMVFFNTAIQQYFINTIKRGVKYMFNCFHACQGWYRHPSSLKLQTNPFLALWIRWFSKINVTLNDQLSWSRNETKSNGP